MSPRFWLLIAIFLASITIFVYSATGSRHYPRNEPVVDPDTGEWKAHWVEAIEPGFGGWFVLVPATFAMVFSGIFAFVVGVFDYDDY